MRFTHMVRETINREVEPRKDSLQMRFKDVYRVQPEEWDSLFTQLLKGELDKARDYLTTYFDEAVVANQIVDSVVDLGERAQVVDARQALELSITKSIYVLEQQMASILKKFEKRNERV